MITIGRKELKQLIDTESGVHYRELPPNGEVPFVTEQADSKVLLSAPHGAITHRRVKGRIQLHEEDEYCAGMALLLSKLCGTSAIATVWCTERADPNRTGAQWCSYKNALLNLALDRDIRYILDLHGAQQNETKHPWVGLVDLGTGVDRRRSLPREDLQVLDWCIARRLGTTSAHHDRFSAQKPGTIRAFSSNMLGLRAVQIEMKPSVRVPMRRPDASAYGRASEPTATPDAVIAMMQALADFIDYLHHLP